MINRQYNELIADSPETAFEGSPLPVGIEGKLAKVDWKKRDVLVGVLKSQQQLEICKEHHFYYIPASRVGEEYLPIHYVAIYQSRNLFGKENGIYLYGEVTRCSLLRRKEITETGGQPRNPEKLYYRLDVREWKELPRPIAVRESASVALFTNLFLLLHSREVPDLRIASEEEFRLYYELKRLAGRSLSADPERPLCYRYKDCLLDYEDGKVRVLRDGRIVYTASAEQVVRHPYESFGVIRRMMSK